LKIQVERSRSVLVLLLFGYKVTRTEWLQLGNILLRSGIIPLQKINRTEPLHSHPTLTVTLRSIHSATKQKIESLRSRLPNTEQSGSVPRIRDGTAPFYLAPQPNTTLGFGMPKVRKTPSLSSLSRNDLNIPSVRWSHHRTDTHDLVILLFAPCGPPFSECERLFGECRWLDDSPSHLQHYINRRVGVKLLQHSLLSYCCAAKKLTIAEAYSSYSQLEHRLVF
jgi:hypothetical protein